MQLRSLHPGEEAALISLALSSVEAPYDLRPVVREKLFGRGFAGNPETIVAATGERLAGFYVRCGRWVRLLGVAPSHRGRGAGSSLLAHAEAAAREESTGKLTIAAEPGNYFTPGLVSDTSAVSFFLSRGYTEREEAINLDATLEIFGTPIEGRPEVRRPKPEEAPRVLEWISNRFSRKWSFEVSPAFDRPEPSIFIAESGNRIIGFSAHDANNRGLGWYGPAGVDSAERSKGIGRALLLASLADLRHLGYNRAIIPWVSSVDFYARSCGARVAHTFSILEKSL